MKFSGAIVVRIIRRVFILWVFQIVLNQEIKKILIDDDQDCLIFRVELGGMAASCHVGYKSCFYRSLEGKNELVFTETEKVFDPEEVYEGQENPTIL